MLNENYEYMKFGAISANFVSIESLFSLNTEFLSQLCVFSAKLPLVIQRLVYQENAFKKSQNLSPF